MSVSNGKFSVSYNYNKWGNLKEVSDYDTSFTPKGGKKVPVHMKQDFKGSEKNDVNLMYKFNNHLDLLYNHNESVNRWAYKYANISNPSYTSLNGNARYTRKFERDKDFTQLNFNDGNGLSGHAFYNHNTLITRGTTYYSTAGSKLSKPTPVYTKETNNTYGYDVQKVWNQANQTFLAGTSLTRETYESAGKDYGRNIFSLFGSWDKHLTEKDNLTIGGRGTWTFGGPITFHNFSGQAQYLHKINSEQSFYTSVGQSFVLPTFTQMYSRSDISASNRIDGNPDLKPQKGTHYELGWKMENPHRQYKVALFSEKIKDNITFTKYTKTYEDKSTEDRWWTINEDFKNRGIEFSVRGNEDSGFNWHVGLTLQNPKTKQNTQNTASKRYWDRSYGKVLVNGGLGYEKDKWSTALNFTYLADRVKTPTATHSYAIKPYLLTSMSAKYSPNNRSDILFSLDNILGRRDVTSHTSSDYYCSPRTFMLSYRYKF